MKRVKQFWLLVREAGLVKSFGKAAGFISRKVLRLKLLTWIIMRRDLGKPIVGVITGISVEIREIGPGELDKFQDNVEVKEKITSFQERFNKGDVCFGALHENKVIAYCWTSFTDHYEPSVDALIGVNADAGEVYTYDMFVAPEHRNKKLAAALSTARLRFLRERGYASTKSLILNTNRISLMQSKSTGAEPYGCLTLIRLFGFSFRFCDVPTWHWFGAVLRSRDRKSCMGVDSHRSCNHCAVFPGDIFPAQRCTVTPCCVLRPRH